MLKIGDKVTVPAMVNGYGVDLPAIVCFVKKILGKTRVLVHYLDPDPHGRTCGTFYDFHLKYRL